MCSSNWLFRRNLWPQMVQLIFLFLEKEKLQFNSTGSVSLEIKDTWLICKGSVAPRFERSGCCSFSLTIKELSLRHSRASLFSLSGCTSPRSLLSRMEAGTPKYEAPLLLYSTFLRKVRGHFLSLCQSISRSRWGGRVLLTEAAIKRKPTVSTLSQHSYSCHHDTAGSLRMNLIFYSTWETYSGNSNHFSLLL